MMNIRFAVGQGIICMAMAGAAMAQWNSDPTVGLQVDDATIYEQTDFRLLPDGQGGAVTGWFNLNATGPTNGSVLKRITRDGDVQWDPANTANYNNNVWGMVSDGAGGAFVALSAYDVDARQFAYVQHYSSSGVKLWGAQGARATALDRTYQTEDKVAITGDGNGGVILTWADNRVNGRSNFYAQKLNASGERQWGDGGVRLSQASAFQNSASIISDASGGAIVCWVDSRNGNVDVFGQRVSNNGVLLWDTNDVNVCNAAGHQRGPRLVPDGLGGALMAWEDTRSGTYSFYAHRIDNNAAPVWPANGVAISTDARGRYYCDLVYTASGVYLTFTNSGNSLPTEIRLQKLDFANGDRLWGNSGLLVPNTLNCQESAIEDDGAGGVITAWCDYRTTDQIHLYAQRVTDSGAFQWDLNGMPVCTATGADCSYVTLLNVSPGESIVAWGDERNLPTTGYPKSQVYAAYLQNNGTLRGTSATRDWQLWE